MYSFSSGNYVSKNLSQGNDHRYEQWVCKWCSTQQHIIENLETSNNYTKILKWFKVKFYN